MRFRVDDLVYLLKNESIRCMRWLFYELRAANVSRNVLITSPHHCHLKGNGAESSDFLRSRRR